ncbi:hypothetical protein GDO81_016370 [Engystomops pustulosus]|uniref:Uncharacterized protein n=1 Tax=Engystomops pustulosus TaxID=76066 RepID=A0AAV7ARM0_ENGPU|nr:hypothetical protein GDO81_016370 [Engystomops pustulosus]
MVMKQFALFAFGGNYSGSFSMGVETVQITYSPHSFYTLNADICTAAALPTGRRPLESLCGNVYSQSIILCQFLVSPHHVQH